MASENTGVVSCRPDLGGTYRDDRVVVGALTLQVLRCFNSRSVSLDTEAR